MLILIEFVQHRVQTCPFVARKLRVMREYILVTARELHRARRNIDFDEIAATAGVDVCIVHDYFRSPDAVREALVRNPVGAAGRA